MHGWMALYVGCAVRVHQLDAKHQSATANIAQVREIALQDAQVFTEAFHDTGAQNITSAAYIGVNTAGQRVYWDSCYACGKTYDTVPQGRTCPYCGSGDTHLLQGNACSIREIEAR